MFEGFGELNQIDNFPHGLEVLILHIDTYNSFQHLPSSLEFTAIIDGFYSYIKLNAIQASKTKPIIIIPFNVKTFITGLYEIKMENSKTQFIITKSHKEWDSDESINNNIIIKNLPEKYKDYCNKCITHYHIHD